MLRVSKSPPKSNPFCVAPCLAQHLLPHPRRGVGGVVMAVPVLAKGAALLKHPSLRKLRHHHEK